MRGQVTTKQREVVAAALEGGRACPVPDLTAPHGPYGMRRSRRSFPTTGVITADLVERTFVAASDDDALDTPRSLSHDS